jgi:RHS repeat-associated protein
MSGGRVRTARSLARLVVLTVIALLGAAMLPGRAHAQCFDGTHGVTLHPCGGSVTGIANGMVTFADTLTVTGGGGSGVIMCSPSGSVTSCSVTPQNYSDAPGSTNPFTVSGTLSATPGSGSIAITFSGTEAGLLSETIFVTVAPPITVTAIRGPNWYDSAQATITNQAFAVTNTSTAQTTYNLTYTCTPAEGCTLPHGATITIAAGGDSTVPVSYSSPNLGSTVAQSLTATATNNSAYSATGSVTEHAALDRVKGVVVHTLTDHSNIRTGADTTLFTVTNKSRFSTSVTLTPTCTGPAFTGTCTVSPASPINVGGGATSTISVLSTGSSTTGATGSVKLVASLPTFPSGNDSATTDVQVTAQPAPGIVLQSQGANFENADCLTVSIQPGVAYACGDLRIAHALPAAWTYNKKRQPILIYRARTARPSWIIRGLVTLDPTKGTPDSVTAKTADGGARGKYTATDFANGATRQIALWTYISHNFEPEIFQGNFGTQTLQVNAYYGTTNLAYSATTPALIDLRDTSRIGPGWGLAGLEYLAIWPQTGGAPNWVWYGGDGSVREYFACCGSTHPAWWSPSLDRPDSLHRVVTGSGQVTLVRAAPHGVQVVFDSATGHHIQTIDRLGHVTQFFYRPGTYMDLDSLWVPAPSGRHLKWIFYYNTTSGYLDSINGPPVSGQSRKVTLTHAPTSHVLTQITDPDGTSESFTYSAYDRPSDPGVVVGFTDKIGTLTTFTYDSTYFLRQAVRDTGSGHIDATVKFTPAETRGLGIAGTVTASAPPDSVYTMVDGPRTGITVSKFWIDGYGQPTRIRDPLGYETILTRGDSRWPVAVTRARGPSGQVQSATYDTRGNLATHTDSSTFTTVNGTTTYATDSAFWDQTWDFAIRTVTATGIESWVELDAATGNRKGQMTLTTPVPSDTTGNARWIRFAYDPATELVSSVSTTQTAPTEVLYDTLGNLSAQVTSLGYWSSFFRDNIGRDTTIVANIDSTDFAQYSPSDGFHHKFSIKHYDPLDRVIASSDSAGSMGLYDPCNTNSWTASGLALDITTVYNNDGTVASLTRWSSPSFTNIHHAVTQKHYDKLGRKIVQIEPDKTQDSVVVDVAGNPVTEVTRSGYVITSTYDALNRRMSTIIPPTIAHDTTEAEFGFFPRYADNGVSRGELLANSGNVPLSVPADTQTFTYDASGHLHTAFNRDAHVSRTYNANGTPATDTLRIRTYSGIDFLTHVYGLSYSYDLDLRRTAIHQPGTLAYVAGDSESFAYDQTAGNLYSATDVRGNWFQYLYDPIDRINTLAYFEHGNNQSVSAESFFYDGDSRTLAHQDFMTLADGSDTGWTNHQLRADTNSHDGRGKVMNILIHQGQLVTPEKIRNRYDGLGQLAVYKRTLLNPDGTEKDEGAVQDLKYDQADAFGNEASVGECIQSGNNINRTYDSLSARITFQRFVDDGDGVSSVAHEWDNYDAEGNLEFQRRDGGFERGPTNGIEDDESVSFYGADSKVHFTDRRNNYLAYQDSSLVHPFTLYKTYFDEFRYDALGRRVMRRSRANSACDSLNCYSMMQRFVYDGDQLLWEISRPGWDTVSVANLEADTTQVPVDSRLYGRVLYLNGLIGDRPLDITRYGFGYPYPSPEGFHVWGPLVIVPHYNWNDQPDWISFEAGQQYSCLPSPNHGDCAVYRLPDATNAFLHNGTWPTASWLGSTLNGTTENQGSGLQYKRNRFYDPVNATFTQEDPIGVAGGLNAYGFGGGDPVSYGDPQGTCGNFCVILIGAAIGAAVNDAYHGYHLYSRGYKLTFGNMWGAALTGALQGAHLAEAIIGLQGALSSIAEDAVILSSDGSQAPQTSGDFTNAAQNPAPEHDTFWLHSAEFSNGDNADPKWFEYNGKIQTKFVDLHRDDAVPGDWTTKYSGYVVRYPGSNAVTYKVSGSIINFLNGGRFKGTYVPPSSPSLPQF